MPESKACHNCRRRRLRCDRSVPACHKCSIVGQKCLGYGKLYRWTDTLVPNSSGITRRPSPETTFWNPDRAVTLGPHGRCFVTRAGEQLSNSPATSLLDPVLQDLDLASRHYLFYFATRFCQDLVVHDSMRHGANPFRELIPMSQMHPFLQHIIVAVSAVHYSQAMAYGPSQSPHCAQVAANALVDALRARQKSIRALLSVLERCRNVEWDESNRSEKDALLATVLFFLNFSLIDSGGHGWREHLKAAGKLLSARFSQSTPIATSPGYSSAAESAGTDKSITRTTTSSPDPFTASLRCQALGACDYVASDTVAYYIWSLALDSIACSQQEFSSVHGLFEWDTTNILNILLRTEANSYHSCPARLMYMLLRAGQLAQAVKSQGYGIPNSEQMNAFLNLMREVESFDIDDWAVGICVRNVEVFGVVNDHELNFRIHIAATYRSVICLFILLVAPGLPAEVRKRERSDRTEDDLPELPNTEDLATTILHHLSFIPSSSPLFKYTTWVVFVTGVEAESPARRAWILDRLQAMHVFCPWGMLTAAIETLTEIWRLRDKGAIRPQSEAIGEAGTTSGQGIEHQGSRYNDWLVALQEMKIDCLIV